MTIHCVGYYRNKLLLCCLWWALGVIPMNLFLKLPTVLYLKFRSHVPECFPIALKLEEIFPPVCVPFYFHRYVTGGQRRGGSLEKGRALYPRCLASLKTLDMELGCMPVCQHWKHDVSKESSCSLSLFPFCVRQFHSKALSQQTYLCHVMLLFCFVMLFCFKDRWLMW